MAPDTRRSWMHNASPNCAWNRSHPDVDPSTSVNMRVTWPWGGPEFGGYCTNRALPTDRAHCAANHPLSVYPLAYVSVNANTIRRNGSTSTARPCSAVSSGTPTDLIISPAIALSMAASVAELTVPYVSGGVRGCYIYSSADTENTFTASRPLRASS